MQKQCFFSALILLVLGIRITRGGHRMLKFALNAAAAHSRRFEKRRAQQISEMPTPLQVTCASAC